jgi:hypothetical protein
LGNQTVNLPAVILISRQDRVRRWISDHESASP